MKKTQNSKQSSKLKTKELAPLENVLNFILLFYALHFKF